MKKMVVVAALIEKCGKFFIAQRSYGDLVGKWEFPGGKVEKNETDKKAIMREIYEELNISVKCDNFLCSSTFTSTDQKIELRLYHCTYLSGEVILKAHSSCVFVDKNLLLTYDLAPLDIEIVKKLIAEDLI